MAQRIPRRRSEADTYHVYLRGSGRQLIYEDDRDRQVFLHILAIALRESLTTLYSYALMGNHYHLIIKSDYDKLPTFAHKLNCAYATYFNDRHNREGHLFEGRYKSQPINDDAYFLEAIRYVHRNPVAARMSPTCDFPWSSYGDYLAKTDQVGFCSETVSLKGHPRDQPLIRPVITDTAKALETLGGTAAFVDFHSHECKRRLADDRPDAGSMTEADMIEVARYVLKGFEPNRLKSLPKPDRDRGLRLLKTSMLTQSQIALVTGLSASTVSRA